MANGTTEFWGTNPADPPKVALREHLRRRLTGEAVSPEPLFEQFPAHREELTEQLRTIELLASAREQAFLDTLIDWTCGEDDSDSPDQFGRYQVIEKLATGGQASLYRCYDPQFRRDVAVKWYRHELDLHQQGPIPDGPTLATLKVPGLVQVHDVGIHENRFFLVLEYVAGLTLNEAARQHGFSARQIARHVAAAAGIVHELHRQNAVHCDLKPQNIMLDESGKIRVIDLGLAVLRSRFEWLVANDVPATGGIGGTASYMAPEQARGETSSIRPQTDVFGLGAVLYDLIVGRPPYVGDKQDGALSQARQGRVPRPRSVNPKVPWALDRICRKALASEPQARFHSAKSLQRYLRLYANAGRWGAAVSAALLIAILVVGVFRPPPATPRPTLAARDLDVRIWNRQDEVIVRDKERREVTRVPVSNGGSVTVETAAEHAGARKGKSGDKSWQSRRVPVDPAPPPAIVPFDAKKAKEHQATWTKHLGVPVEYTNTLGMKFVFIPPGEFTMGSAPAEIEEGLKVTGKDGQGYIKSAGPQHQVILTQPIYLGVHEVTQAQYEKVLGQNPSWFAATGPGKDAVIGVDSSTYPVEMVSWNNATEFCKKLSQKEKLKAFKFELRAGETVRSEGTGYRLPTEAEGEFACRAGTTTKYWIGDKDDDLPQAGWCIAHSGNRTHAVGELKANPFGLFDIHGNVWEWVQDWWEPTYYGQFQGRPALDPNGPSHNHRSERVFRGGSWRYDASNGRASNRGAGDPTSSLYNIGFRVALVVGVSRVGRP
ncbi:MAG: bifunctional serine/threonine-protein kinase/formylglycine-generating enzyme family protein [Planctomycetota bacterium]|nr:bifunctional serine/threonine-protein kinase/formylglycine-generating enzyme family protein [Planctomycetota bacterium]